jgi:hypothetical protein
MYFCVHSGFSPSYALQVASLVLPAHRFVFKQLLRWVSVFLVLYSCHSVAEEAASVKMLQGYLGFSGMDFGFEEFDDSADSFLREEGFVPGFVAGLSAIRSSWFLAGDFSYHAGDIRYDGQTNTGIPVKTRTDEKLLDASFHLGHEFKTGTLFSYTLYGGFGYRRWYRDIRPTETVSGISETYAWWYGSLGTAGIFHITSKLEWIIDVHLTRTIAPNVKVDFKDLFDDTSLDLGERFGMRLALPLHYLAFDHTAIVVEPYFERWDLGRSITEPLTRRGAIVGTVFEPRSETRNFGINLGVMYSFH